MHRHFQRGYEYGIQSSSIHAWHGKDEPSKEETFACIMKDGKESKGRKDEGGEETGFALHHQYSRQRNRASDARRISKKKQKKNI